MTRNVPSPSDSNHAPAITVTTHEPAIHTTEKEHQSRRSPGTFPNFEPRRSARPYRQFGRSRPIAAPDYKQNYFSTHYCA